LRHCTSRSHVYLLDILSLFGGGLSAICTSLTGLVREARGVLLPPAISGGALLYFQCNDSTSSAINAEWSASTGILCALVLVTSFCHDTACSTTLGMFAERLIAPLWHRGSERRPASTASSTGASRSLRQWLCSPSHNEKNTRSFRSVHISHNPPAETASLAVYSCI
jgi:hypothetical protein